MIKGLQSRIFLYFRRTSLLVWVLCLLLSSLSLILLSGILDSGYAVSLGISKRNLWVQGISIGLGICSAVAISLIDYRAMAKAWKFYVPICYLLLLLTFLIGVGASGRPEDKRWLIIPGINLSFQPAELLRIAFILIFAYHIHMVQKDIHRPLCLGGLMVHGAIPVLLLHFQGDDGSALIISVTAICMLFCAEISWKHLLGGAVFLGASLPILWFSVLNNFQKQRIMALYDPSAQDIQGFYYQQHRASLALASGGVGGSGIWNAGHTYVPEMHNDFIFSFLGECFGFIGIVILFIILLCLWVRIISFAGKASDTLGQLICIGIFAILSFQTMLNVGMNISVLPVIGNPLPFISCGGSSTLTSYMGIGLVLSVHMHTHHAMFC